MAVPIQMKKSNMFFADRILGLFLILFSVVSTQGYEIRTYQISTTQQSISSDSLVLKGTVGSAPYQNISSDSLQLKGGMTNILTNLFKSPPLLTTFISDTIKKDAMPVIIRAIGPEWY